MNTKALRMSRNTWRIWTMTAALMLPAGASRAEEFAAGPSGRPSGGMPATAIGLPGDRLVRPAHQEEGALPGLPPRPAASAEAPAPSSAADRFKTMDFDVKTAGCSTCGGFHSLADGPTFHAPVGCADGSCIPGRGPCYATKHTGSHTIIGGFLSNLYQCLCCPDPCYQPKWVPAANASFFADYARPRTITRFRYDNLNDMKYPDRNQFFLKGLPIAFEQPFRSRGVQYRADPSARLQQIYLYQEIAGEKGSFFVETPYRQINPLFSPTQAGFSDVNFGVKSLLFDCEMLQVSFQFRTHTPSGDASKALGTGHFALEPSLLASLKLADDTYFQAQVGNWIPLGGDQQIAGGVFFWFFSLNQVIYRCTPDSPLIATLEFDGWSFQDGGYTQPVVIGNRPVVRADGGGVSYFNIGPGLRQSICDKVDIGGAVTFATGSGHWADPWFRFEVRFLF